MPQRPTSKDVATLAGRLADDRVVRAERPDGHEDPGRDAAAGPATPHGSWATTPTPPPAGWPVAGATHRARPPPVARAGGRGRPPRRDPARARRRGADRRLPGPGRAARPGPDGHYTDLLRAQHADGLVVSGPRVDDPELVELVRDGFPIVLQGSMPDLRTPSVDVDNVAGARARSST